MTNFIIFIVTISSLLIQTYQRY